MRYAFEQLMSDVSAYDLIPISLHGNTIHRTGLLHSQSPHPNVRVQCYDHTLDGLCSKHKYFAAIAPVITVGGPASPQSKKPALF